MKSEDFDQLEISIRDILDRNGFASQKIDPKKMKRPPNSPVPQDAFRIRVSQPLRFQVEIVKPIQLRDFIFLAGRLNVATQHQKAIGDLEVKKRMELFDDIRLELGRQPPTVKFEVANNQLIAVECMVPVIITDENNLVKDLFSGMDAINKSFFTVIFIMQRHLRLAGITPSVDPNTQPGPSPFYQ